MKPLLEVKIEQAQRTPWGAFPDVLIHRTVAEVTRHPQYAAAKAGDVPAAQRLVDALLVPQMIARLGVALKGRQATLAPVFAEEELGINRIPAVMAEALESRLPGVSVGTTLTGQAYSAKLTPGPATLAALRAKHGNALEEWLRETFGYGFDRLTESEARNLTRAESLDVIRNRIAQARSGRDR